MTAVAARGLAALARAGAAALATHGDVVLAVRAASVAILAVGHFFSILRSKIFLREGAKKKFCHPSSSCFAT